MRIVLVTDSFYPREGGAERQLRRVCAELVKEPGWEVIVVARRFANMVPREVIDGLVVERYGPPAGGLPGTARASLLSAFRVARLRPDAVIALQVGSSAVAAVAGSRLRGRRHPPVVIRLTGGSAAGSELAIRADSPKARRIVGVLLRLSTAIVAPARHLLDEPGPYSAVLEAKGVVIPNGVVSPIGTDASGDCVVWMGRPDPVKGFEEFVELARRCPDLHFLAIGPPPSAENPANLECTGWVDDPGPHLSRAAVFVSTSRFEGSPNSALEALAGGIPVVAWDIPAYRELANATGNSVTVVPIDNLPKLVSATRDAIHARSASRVDSDHRSASSRFGVPRLDETTAQWRDLLYGIAAPAYCATTPPARTMRFRRASLLHTRTRRTTSAHHTRLREHNG